MLTAIIKAVQLLTITVEATSGNDTTSTYEETLLMFNKNIPNIVGMLLNWNHGYNILDNQHLKDYVTTLESTLKSNKRELPENLTIDPKYSVIDEFCSQALDFPYFIQKVTKIPVENQKSPEHTQLVKALEFYNAILKIFIRNNVLPLTNDKKDLSIATLHAFMINKLENSTDANAQGFKAEMNVIFDSMVEYINEIWDSTNKEGKIIDSQKITNASQARRHMNSASKRMCEFSDKMAKEGIIDASKHHDLLVLSLIIDGFDGICNTYGHIFNDFLSKNENHISNRSAIYFDRAVMLVKWLFLLAIQPEKMADFFSDINTKYSELNEILDKKKDEEKRKADEEKRKADEEEEKKRHGSGGNPPPSPDPLQSTKTSPEDNSNITTLMFIAVTIGVVVIGYLLYNYFKND